ncbi:hypothetical protein FSP39_011384, partial [Pinctada imbricata]
SSILLQQMSVKRLDLEKSSDRISSELELLQKINEEQNQRISNTLTELQQQQLTNQRLLQSDWMEKSHHHSNIEASGVTSPGSRKVQREPSVIRKLRQWNTSEVIKWLENRKLHRFIFLFQRHHVTGPDLADLKLPFLESYEHISTEERELLLSEVYELLHLELDDDDDLMRITTPKEKEKYLAAKQIAGKDKEHVYHRSQSVPAVYLSSQTSASSSSSPSSTTSSPTPKLRKKSDTETHGVLSKLVQKPNFLDITPHKSKAHSPNPIRKSFEKLKPKKRSSSSSASLYEALHGHPGQKVTCCVLHKHNGQFGISMEKKPNGQFIVSQSNQELLVKAGDRVLEVNGQPCTHSLDVEEIYRENDKLYIVTGSSLTSPSDSPTSYDWKWQKLRTYLQDMKEKDIDPGHMMEHLPQDQIQDIKDKAALQEELDSVRAQLAEQHLLIEKLQEEMSDTKAELEEVREHKDKAVSALKAKVQARKGKSDAPKHGETQYYKITMETLNVDSANKDQIMESLKEIVKEASRQKYYLDRLISVVIEEVPWILEQVDADFDNVSIDGQTEEFC